MANFVESIKDNLVAILLTAIITALGALFINIFSDVLPAILPFLEKLSLKFYLKIILLLSSLLVISLILATVLAAKLNRQLPRILKGKDYGLNWQCQIAYKRSEIDIKIDTFFNFLCPIHDTFLGLKDANVPECAYHELYCRTCNKTYPIKNKNSVLYVEDAERLLHNQIVRKIRIPNGPPK